MASITEVIDRLAQATGTPRNTVERQLRALRDADLWPKSGFGGGRAAREAEVRHLADLTLAMAGTQPHDGPAAVAALRPLRLVERSIRKRSEVPSDRNSTSLFLVIDDIETKWARHRTDDVAQPGLTLGEALERLIWCLAASTTAVMRTSSRDEADLVASNPDGSKLYVQCKTYRCPKKLALSTDMPAATLVWTDEGDWIEIETFLPALGVSPRVPQAAAPRRMTSLSPEWFFTVAMLLAETIARGADPPHRRRRQIRLPPADSGE